jgi:hypothetical protein
MYTRSRGGGTLIVDVHVDDLIITSTSKEIIITFKLEMKDRFQMSDLDLLSYYLEIEVKQGTDGISLCQSMYVRQARGAVRAGFLQSQSVPYGEPPEAE